MKRYKNLWQQFISIENFELAAKKAVKSKKNKKSTRKFLANRDELLRKLRQSLIDGTFKTSPYRIFTIFEPKKRDIYELPLYPDHIVHHALINIIGPIWQSMFIHDSYACIPGRGLHAASKRVMQFVRRNKYVLQCDIRKFFPSIDHDVMIDILRQKIGDRKFLAVLSDIIRSIRGGKNLPIGNLTSQWMGNVYLNQLDMFVKHILHCHDYIRYCDDFCLFGNDKGVLWGMLKKIGWFLTHKLRLQLSKYYLKPTAHGVNIIGYRHFRRFVLLRARGVHKILRRLLNIARYDDFSLHAVGQVAAAHGWLKWACTHNLREKLYDNLLRISPFAYNFISVRLDGMTSLTLTTNH